MAYKEEREYRKEEKHKHEERREERHEKREERHEKCEGKGELMHHAKDKMAEITKDGKQGERVHFRGNMKAAGEYIEKQPT